MSNISKIQINGVLYNIDDAVARQALTEHAANQSLHITEAERSLWNTGQVAIKTTEEWNAEFSYIPTMGYICVYSDYTIITNTDGSIINIPALKIGDGTTYLIDLPFIVGTHAQEALDSHINDTIIHTTKLEKTFWNNKVSCLINNSNPEELVFFKD
jgi:hypothetical protein